MVCPGLPAPPLTAPPNQRMTACSTNCGVSGAHAGGAGVWLHGLEPAISLHPPAKKKKGSFGSWSLSIQAAGGCCHLVVWARIATLLWWGLVKHKRSCAIQ